jgi:hypothetical protein
MWSIKYKEFFYIQGKFDTKECDVLYSPSGIGFAERWKSKSLHAAKISVTKYLRQKLIEKYQRDLK